ncbi:MAG: Do family serine endopeptidase [Nitrospirae bacterium]|nr:Do family serine endopeptidase [Nitrospirota bacterium]MBI3594687.1 Do family serine endopeptidase [Nitrospirota bacterium]
MLLMKFKRSSKWTHLITFLLVSFSMIMIIPASAKSAGLDEAVKTLEQFQTIFIEIAAKSKPAVVNISPVQTSSHSAKSDDSSPERKRPDVPQGSGSGVIIDKKGTIITNQHVVSDAKEVEVRLSDKRKFIGKVIGRDNDTDVAVVKIEAPGDLPSLAIGDSTKVKVGQWAIAVGNPFGLEGTVTLGVISATGRESVNLSRYEDFIQTDASINPGNSGGPLLNLKGEVIGINTAIINFAQGIGFAIPSNMVQEVITQLIKTGKVTRGWLGIGIQEVSSDLADKFHIKEGEGILVSEVFEGEPAFKAGVQPGDIITRIDGREITSTSTLSRIVASITPGKKIELAILRDGKAKNLPIILGERKEDPKLASVQKQNETLLGITVTEITPELKEKYKLKADKGVLITRLDPDSRFEIEGLKEGDVIKELNKQKIESVSEFNEAAKKIKESDSPLIYINRESRSFFIVLKAKEK